MAKPKSEYKMKVSFETHKREHEGNYILAVGCPYCKPEIDRIEKK